MFFYGHLHGHLPLISQTIQVTRTRHTGHCWRSEDELISDVFYGPLHGHLPPISQTIQVTRIRHEGNCWRSKDELIGDVLLWTPIRPLTFHLTNHPSNTNKTWATLMEKQGRTHKWCSSMDPFTWSCLSWLTQLSADTGCGLEDQPGTMDIRDRWWERESAEMRAIWWWWWWW